MVLMLFDTLGKEWFVEVGFEIKKILKKILEDFCLIAK